MAEWGDLMTSIMLMFLGSVLTGAGVAVGGFVVKKASNRIKWENPDMDFLKSELDKIINSQSKTSKEIQALFQLQEPQIKALIVLLEVYKTGVANGNIDEAIKEVRKAERGFHDFLMGGVG